MLTTPHTRNIVRIEIPNIKQAILNYSVGLSDYMISRKTTRYDNKVIDKFSMPCPSYISYNFSCLINEEIYYLEVYQFNSQMIYYFNNKTVSFCENENTFSLINIPPSLLKKIIRDAEDISMCCLKFSEICLQVAENLLRIKDLDFQNWFQKWFKSEFCYFHPGYVHKNGYVSIMI